jgi:DNA-binding FadR family transcriptional regulator
MMDMLRDSFWAYFRLKHFIPTREETALIWRLHADVYEAVRARSPDRARAAIIAHMDFVEGKLAESLEEFDAGEAQAQQ